jgi:hypothetical protein
MPDITVSDVEYLNVRYLSVDPLTRRDTYDSKIMKMIEEDISEHGFRKEHPLVVRPDNTKGKGFWKITCGQHRFEAGKARGISDFPCVKKEFQDDIHAISEAYHDNVLACPVDAITEAEYFRNFGLLLLKKRGHSRNSVRKLKRKYPEELIALQMHVSKAYVMHRLALLRLPKIVQWMIKRYYQHERGLKLNPTIGAELSRIYKNIWAQKKAGITKVNAKSAITKLALKLSREKATLHETRIIGADIAYKGYDAWVSQKRLPENTIRCAKCGEMVAPEDNPWLALCPAHKEKYLNKQLKPNPHLKPLHEIEPQKHSVKNVTIYKDSKGKNATVKNVNVLNKRGFSDTFRAMEKASEG